MSQEGVCEWAGGKAHGSKGVCNGGLWPEEVFVAQQAEHSSGAQQLVTAKGSPQWCLSCEMLLKVF